ncbi:MAG: hypothetical protein R3F30_14685 [Planctomycetota bacterium]
MPSPALLSACLLAVCAVPATAQTRVDPLGRKLLFVRGADGSGGATEGGTTAQRTEQLSDVGNAATNNGNHGYGELRQALVADGFQVAQLVEDPKVPLTLTALLPYRVVFLGSNNRAYTAAEVKAFHDYVDAGGSALFVSDANWGLTWNAAPASDNQFLARYGVQVWQDSGQLPVLERKQQGRYLDLDHAVVSGLDGDGGADDVDAYVGEGVSLFRLGQGSDGWQARAQVTATGLVYRTLDSSGKAGSLQLATSADCALWTATKGDSRLAGHFDRNTWFNLNGAGTDIRKRANLTLARDLFRWLASVPGHATPRGASCPSTMSLSVSGAALGRVWDVGLSGGPVKAPTLLLLAPGAARALDLGSGCALQCDPLALLTLPAPATDELGRVKLQLPWPADLGLSGLTATMQVLAVGTTGPLLGVLSLSSGVEVRLGARQ